jgi:hypothetical protein
MELFGIFAVHALRLHGLVALLALSSFKRAASPTQLPLKSGFMCWVLATWRGSGFDILILSARTFWLGTSSIRFFPRGFVGIPFREG